MVQRQMRSPVVETIGDVYLDIVQDFEPFVRYGGHQMYGKYMFEKEKAINPVFFRFVEVCVDFIAVVITTDETSF